MHYLHEKAALFFATCLVSLAPAFPLSWLTSDFFYALLSVFQYAIHNRAIQFINRPF
jgi:hypothetical protein